MDILDELSIPTEEEYTRLKAGIERAISKWFRFKDMFTGCTDIRVLHVRGRIELDVVYGDIIARWVKLSYHDLFSDDTEFMGWFGRKDQKYRYMELESDTEFTSPSLTAKITMCGMSGNIKVKYFIKHATIEW